MAHPTPAPFLNLKAYNGSVQQKSWRKRFIIPTHRWYNPTKNKNSRDLAFAFWPLCVSYAPTSTVRALVVCENVVPQNRTLYSAHWCNKLRKNVKCHDCSWRAREHFYLSNVVRGQKLEKLLSDNKARFLHWRILYAPLAVKLSI